MANDPDKISRTAHFWAGLLTAAALISVGLMLWRSLGREPLGDQLPTYGAGQHVADGNPLPPFSTDPPTSGPHYITPLEEGFYNTNHPAVSMRNPQGHIVHSMEHGYVIFWYNCAVLSETDCAALKSGLQEVMQDYDSFKIIAFPWTTTDVPVVATSWGRILRMEVWDAGLAAEFIERNRNQSPEPFTR